MRLLTNFSDEPTPEMASVELIAAYSNVWDVTNIMCTHINELKKS